MPLSEPQPRRSARDAKSHKKANPKAIAEDLLSCFSALEDDCVASQPSRKGADTSTVTSQCRSEEEKQGLGPSESGRSAAQSQSWQDDGEEAI